MGMTALLILLTFILFYQIQFAPLAIIPAILAIIFGSGALKKIKTDNQKYCGKGFRYLFSNYFHYFTTWIIYINGPQANKFKLEFGSLAPTSTLQHK